MISDAVARAVITEASRREYSHPETLSVLTLAIDESWTAIAPAFFDRLDAVRADHSSSIDPWTNLFHLRTGKWATEDPTAWRAYKNRLYTHIRAAAALYDDRGEGPLDALTPEQQHQLLEDVREIRAQLGPRAHESWPSLGVNDKDEELTLRDAFGVMKKDVAAVKKKLGA